MQQSSRTGRRVSSHHERPTTHRIAFRAFRFSVCLLFLLLPAAFASAQEFTGRVTDSSGAAIPNAQVTAHNVDTGINTPTVTTSAGTYTIPYLKPGHYSVNVYAAGFEKGEHTGIVLEVAQTSTVDFNLKVGGASQTVTVDGDTLVDFSKADAGETVENTRVTELPLNGRDPGMLSILEPGALWTGSPQYQRPFDDTQQNLSVNGGGGGNVALMLDGAPNTATSINNTGAAHIAYVPPVDSVQEFKIITNPYDAQYGLMAGGVEDVVLKSGTNKIHGDVYEYMRRTWLDANIWTNDYYASRLAPGQSKAQFTTPPMKWDQYGAELDGPVVIPHLYNGRDKSFFMMQYENWNEIEPNTVTQSVPDPKWLTGDFTSLVYWTGTNYAPISLLDPENIHQNSSGTWVRTPFGPTDTINPTSAPNIIPASRINPVAAKILSYYPAPNTTPPQGSNPFASNFVAEAPDTDKYRNVNGKFSQNFSDKDRFALHYGYWERIEHRSYDGFTGPEQQGQLPHGERSNVFTVEETHTFNPRLLLDFRARAAIRADYSYNGPPFDPTTLGWTPQQVAAMGPQAANEFPYFAISEFASFGTNSNAQTISNSLYFFPSVTWIKGSHTIHAGLDARFMQSINDLVGGGNYFWVDRTWTQTNCGTCGSWDPASGNSIASLLLGNPTSGYDNINVNNFWSAHYWAPFVQDDWKVSRRLTVNLGLRWDLAPAETERHNRGNYAFDATATNPINDQVSVPGYDKILGEFTFLGVNGKPRSIYANVKTYLQPRVGLAYALDSKTVLHVGFGESMRTPQNAPANYGFSSSTNYQANDPTHPGQTYPNLANQIDNPYSSVVQPTGSALGGLEMLGQGAPNTNLTPFYLNSHYHLPSFWNYSVGIQHQFLKNDVFSIAYVGTRLYNGDSSDNINHSTAASYANCNPQLGNRIETCTNDNDNNPFIGINGFQGTPYYTNTTVAHTNFTRPFPEFGDITEYQLNDYHTWYNSLQMTAMHKWSSDLTVHATWTWSKFMDSGGWADQTYRVPYRSIDANDITHRVTLSGVYLLPVGRGRRLFPNMNRVLDAAAGGWELGSLYIYQTGAPWILPGNPNEVYAHNAYVKPHIQKDNGYIRLVAACAAQYKENDQNQYVLVNLPYDYDGSCSSGPNFIQVPNYGETPQNVYTGIRLPRNQQFDANLSKNFALYNRMKLQVRLEAFNVLNHPLWSEQPDNSTNDSTFGLIQRGPSGQSNLPRQLQLSAKVVW